MFGFGVGDWLCLDCGCCVVLLAIAGWLRVLRAMGGVLVLAVGVCGFMWFAVTVWWFRCVWVVVRLIGLLVIVAVLCGVCAYTIGFGGGWQVVGVVFAVVGGVLLVHVGLLPGLRFGVWGLTRWFGGGFAVLAGCSRCYNTYSWGLWVCVLGGVWFSIAGELLCFGFEWWRLGSSWFGRGCLFCAMSLGG